MKTIQIKALAGAALGLLCASLAGADPVGTAFVYHGQLKLGGVAVNDTADIELSLWDAVENGTLVAGPLTAGEVEVADGVFTVSIDFGAGAFTGEARWLEIAVRSPAGGEAFTTLSPRQAISAVPYATYSLSGAGDTHWERSGDDLCDTRGCVGVGTDTPLAPLHGETGGIVGVFGVSSNTFTGSAGVLGSATAETGITSGVRGMSASVTGRGVFGHALATTSTTAYGVYGQSDSRWGRGVHGHATGGSGVGVSGEGLQMGVSGTTFGDDGIAVNGFAQATSGTTFGVVGQVASPDGYAGHFAGPAGSRNYFQRKVGIGTNRPSHLLHLSANDAAKPTSNTWTVASDARLKKNIRTIDSALDDLLRLRGVTYQWIDPATQGGMAGTYMGLIAQEVEEVFPEWIGEGGEGYKHLTVTGFEALAIEAIKKQQRQIETLHAENARKDARIAGIEARLERLERSLAAAGK